jgi:hypothetical protein
MRDDSVVVFTSIARAVLLSEQMCIVLLIRFLVRSSSVHFRIAIILAGSAVERLTIGMLSL